MFEKFGELNSFGEINELAENLFNEGDTESLRAMARAFEDMGKKYSRPVIETEEPPVVVDRTLSERRKKCRRKGWRVSER